MTNKNPYESDNTVDIPEFVEDRSSTRSESIDMSIFKLSNDDTQEYDEYDEEEYEEVHRSRNSNTLTLIFIILIILLLIAAVAAGLYALKQKKNYAALDAQYQTLVSEVNDYKTTISTLENEVNQLTDQLNAKKQESSGTTYEVIENGINFRKGAGTSYDKTTYNGESQAYSGDTFKVSEIVQDSDGNKWAKIADNVYFALEYDGEAYAEKQ